VTTEILDKITREQVLRAIADFNSGKPHAFSESIKYDLDFDGKLYPPKAIIGLAGEYVAGRPLTPKVDKMLESWNDGPTKSAITDFVARVTEEGGPDHVEPAVRVAVFDNDGTFKTQFTNVGTPSAVCMTRGATPFLYSSNSNPPEDFDVAGEIYKLKLDGTIVGKFGRAGKLLKEFGTVNAIDCRSENSLLVGEAGNMRVQKVILH